METLAHEQTASSGTFSPLPHPLDAGASVLGDPEHEMEGQQHGRTSAPKGMQGKVIGFEIWFEALVAPSGHRFQLPQCAASLHRESRG